MSLTNYNSAHSLAEYEVGNSYVFCVHNANAKKFIKADEDIVKLYSSKLEETINNINIEKNTDFYKTLRVVGIVVKKSETDNKDSSNTLTVMFKTKNNNYVINDYIVNSSKIVSISGDNIPIKTII
jgi:hypothetical protein